MRVELSRIIGVKNHRARDAIIDEIIKEAENDPIFISDLLVEHQTADPILTDLRQDKTKKYILKMICGEWGEEPEPDFIIKRKYKKPLKDREGLPIPATILNQWKRAGVYDQKRYMYEEYKLDEKGCFKVDAENAEYFLSQWGVHSISGFPLSYHPQEKSTEPVNYPGGGKRHVHYYRFKEMTQEMYDKLPVLKKTESSKSDKK
jgi:hypothetical protein